MIELADKVAIVTGGSRGIGSAISTELAKSGVKVVVNYHSDVESAKKVVAEVKAAGGEAIAVQADVSNSEDVLSLIEQTINHFGQLDILVNNAGITKDKTFRKLSQDDWHQVINVNLNSVYNTISSALPHLLESDAGRIINISSIIGQTGGFGQTNYSAAKAGLIGYTKSLALELARKQVTVNAVCPGFIETEMVQEMPDKVREQIIASVPVQRLGQANEIARSVLFLCRDGEYITGQQLNINGGLYM
ncbi:acetoacetyl-CoA reductase [Alkalicoccobacillus murimartini]|uniref:Acetoacetyl-CoA reductase n=1 Tax=Alkalicoccobacillus murimartini TaxID=171685 RepID=A0ABT9YEZ7_9BACI|nr:acetoacetyl-CoA reductase [Alkalicoccobacillus murimartini]MDQ0205782.1 acetoacetyl-CoA reductase [Alkalicoccobacillus murimartini]